MFKKSGKRNFRKKIKHSDSENEDNEINKNTIPFIDDDDAYSSVPNKDVAKKKKKEKGLTGVNSGASLLSFENDEDGINNITLHCHYNYKN